MAYITRYRDGFGRFLADGRIEIDNNTVERTIRPIALNRKTPSSPAMTLEPRTGPSSPR